MRIVARAKRRAISVGLAAGLVDRPLRLIEAYIANMTRNCRIDVGIGVAHVLDQAVARGGCGHALARFGVAFVLGAVLAIVAFLGDASADAIDAIINQRAGIAIIARRIVWGLAADAAPLAADANLANADIGIGTICIRFTALVACVGQRDRVVAVRGARAGLCPVLRHVGIGNRVAFDL